MISSALKVASSSLPISYYYPYRVPQCTYSVIVWYVISSPSQRKFGLTGPIL